MSFVYVASPYSHRDPTIRKSRFEIAEAFVAWCLIKKYHVYSPLVHCHALAEKFDLPTTADFWLPYNRAMLAASSALWVLEMPGVDASVGVKAEIAFADQCGIEVLYKHPRYPEARHV